LEDEMGKWAYTVVAGVLGVLVGAVMVSGVLAAHAEPGRARTGSADGGSGAERSVPRDDTIVWVRGTARSGFTVRHYDGAVWHLPTRSEARSECAAYHKRIRRVRCWTEVKTWYHDLGDTKRAIRYARQRNH
jgi:hypothetical protein